MIKKFVFVFILSIVCNIAVYAACEIGEKTYTACKPGYYLSNGNCLSCPSPGTSADNNSNGTSVCYIPSGMSSSDSSGSFTYTSNCHYK